eukprot:CAMPEP_0115354544 /NCGR_PEP_ID=MMETSP0270-20121206/98640_1 /TAXON_ID=71861 /ORGANISM="Scrippsiella trochoidea, Strain CCMP3099" /LENGTH=55 /DNA_ID=CAMNT_0002776879 /DNA_START=435 /DNA_END=598 /DNA_ORIENTATION=-
MASASPTATPCHHCSISQRRGFSLRAKDFEDRPGQENEGTSDEQKNNVDDHQMQV